MKLKLILCLCVFSNLVFADFTPSGLLYETETPLCEQVKTVEMWFRSLNSTTNKLDEAASLRASTKSCKKIAPACSEEEAKSISTSISCASETLRSSGENAADYCSDYLKVTENNCKKALEEFTSDLNSMILPNNGDVS